MMVVVDVTVPALEIATPTTEPANWLPSVLSQVEPLSVAAAPS